MQPQRATRGIAAVALSSAGFGLLLLVLAIMLSACGSSAASKNVASTSSTSAAATSPAASATPAASGSTSAPAPSASSTAPAGDPGTSIVPSVPVTTAPAVPLTAAAPAAGGGRITIGTTTAITGTAQLPGEIGGPAVRVPVTIVNGSGAAIDLNQVVVDLVDAKGVSAGQLSDDPAAPFSGSLAPGATASAVYVFTLATNDRSNVRILVTYTTAAPVVVFTGTVA